MKFNIHAGHNKYVKGASSIIDEVTEDRKVKNELIRLLKAKGHTVYDCTDDIGRTQVQNLYNIVKNCNKHNVDLDISIHLNSGRNDKKGDGKTGGVEVLNYDKRTKAYSDKICQSIAKKLDYTNRGTKYAPNLYVLKNTNNLALLIECCFVDDRDDVNKWNATKCAQAICEALVGFSTTKTSSTNYYKKFSSSSIVDGLKSINVDSSFSNRRKIAKVNGISTYIGTAKQNATLLYLAKQGKLKKV